MDMNIYYLNIMKKLRHDMFKCIDKNGVHKLYRQARIFNRFNYNFGQGCSWEQYRYLHKKFKAYKKEALIALC